jgi:uncharacterized protein (DUF1015 family)
VDHRRNPPTTGLTLEPFRATRYSGVDLATVTSPPYDVVEPDRCTSLESADPYNVVRLILPRTVSSSNRYHHAADTWHQWVQEGILRKDQAPALWVYEQISPTGSLIGVVGTVPIDQPAAVLPHEDVMSGPVRDRAELMDTVGANLEPILLVHDPSPAIDDGAEMAATTQLVDRARVTAPTLELDSDDGARHRLWAIRDPAMHALIAADLSSRSALIADGHHRFAAYQQIQVTRRLDQPSRSPQPWDRGLALIVDGHAHPLELGPIHRTVGGIELTEALDTAGSGMIQAPIAGPAAATQWLAELADLPGMVLTNGSQWVGLTVPDAEAWVPRPDRSKQWRSLPTAVLHDLLIPHRWRVVDDHVAYHHDVPGALRVVAGGGIAVLLPALRLTTVIERAAAGERLPRKSTSFGPKPRSGLLMRDFG